jgi:hypothetical protein
VALKGWDDEMMFATGNSNGPTPLTRVAEVVLVPTGILAIMMTAFILPPPAAAPFVGLVTQSRPCEGVAAQA